MSTTRRGLHHTYEEYLGLESLGARLVPDELYGAGLEDVATP
jgi:hypothetical protein